MVAELNKSGFDPGDILVTTPRPAKPGVFSVWAAVQNQFVVHRRGLLNGEMVDQRDRVAAISRILDPHIAWGEFLASAENPDLTIVVSNTTEAGLVYSPTSPSPHEPATTLAARLTRWFHHRWMVLGPECPPVDVLPLELVARNGHVLQKLMARHVADWDLPEDFDQWLFGTNAFYNTLVDSIVTSAGQDTLDVIREPYYRLVVEGFGPLAERLPFRKAGLSVDFVTDITPYQALKIRALNGPHTALAALGTLAALKTVGEVMAHPILRTYVMQLLQEDIVPTLGRFALPQSEVNHFATDVLERFQNPFLAHRLRDIRLNALAKTTQRLIPALNDFWTLKGQPSARLCVGIAAVLLTEQAPDPRSWWSDTIAAPELISAIEVALANLTRRGWESTVRETLT